MAQLSNERRDKLLAALNYDSVDAGQRLPLAYLRACAIWYAALTALDKMVISGCRAAHARGFQEHAELAAEALPPAPKWPL